ncbi:hypothetical protein HPB50_025824 [Hyalomma asiaticum]|uniref:Uncharacterized protein n=1 Tax=Hyalomma asiaticum TaxID=266040 RepID=A0ACB7SR24_HYAAI|nr:hypothetical protein HPB50_025824 [Hyalomma asiaticum]
MRRQPCQVPRQGRFSEACKPGSPRPRLPRRQECERRRRCTVVAGVRVRRPPGREPVHPAVAALTHTTHARTHIHAACAIFSVRVCCGHGHVTACAAPLFSLSHVPAALPSARGTTSRRRRDRPAEEDSELRSRSGSSCAGLQRPKLKCRVSSRRLAACLRDSCVAAVLLFLCVRVNTESTVSVS